MADIGLNQNISVQDRNFHIQTATNITDGVIHTEVFEQGRLLFAEDYSYEKRENEKDEGAESRLRRVLDNFHRHVISGLETLFELSEILKEKDQAISHHRLGAIFLSLHIYDKAEEHLLKAIDLDPDYYSAFITLARTHFYQKRFQQASYTLEKLTKSEVKYADLYNLHGLILLEQKNYIQSLNHFRHAIRLNPNYKEAYFNLLTAILERIDYLRMQNKTDEVEKNFNFFKIILNKIDNIGNKTDKSLIVQVKQSLKNKNYGKISSLIYDHRTRVFFQSIPPEVTGYEFYLWIRYLPDRMDYETLTHFDEKISEALDENPHYPDLWNYLALIHLMLCRDYFLKGLDNFKEATRINPRFTKAKKNLRLVENDGREFLSLIKAIVK